MTEYTTTIGTRHDEARDLDIAAVAKLVRSEIAAAKKAGLIPKDWKYQVRSSTFAGGRAINVTAVSPRPVYHLTVEMRDKMETYQRKAVHPETGRTIGWRFGENRTDEHVSVSDALETIVAQFNRSTVDSMTDYHSTSFYGQVSVTSETNFGYPTESEWEIAE